MPVTSRLVQGRPERIRAWAESSNQAESSSSSCRVPDAPTAYPDGPASPTRAAIPTNWWPAPPHLAGGSWRAGGTRKVAKRAGAWDCYRIVINGQHTVHSSDGAGRSPGNWLPPSTMAGCGNEYRAWAADLRITIPTTPAWPGGGGRERAEAGVACIFAQIGIPRLDAHEPGEDAASGLLCGFPGGRHYRIGDLELPQVLAERHNHARRFLLREPERSRRAIRLLFANWIAHAEARPGRARPPSPRSFAGRIAPIACCSIRSVPRRPDGAPRLSPQEVACWNPTM